MQNIADDMDVMAVLVYAGADVQTRVSPLLIVSRDPPRSPDTTASSRSLLLASSRLRLLTLHVRLLCISPRTGEATRLSRVSSSRTSSH
eukprot:761183-Hanusia_phi.AAC.2